MSPSEIKHGVLLFNPEPRFHLLALLHILKTTASLVGRMDVTLVVERLAHNEDVITTSEWIPGEEWLANGAPKQPFWYSNEMFSNEDTVTQCDR